MSGEPDNTLYCSFCGISQRETHCLIAGPAVLICGSCVEICVQIISERRQRKMDPADIGLRVKTTFEIA